jgi:hypothetical protein
MKKVLLSILVLLFFVSGNFAQSNQLYQLKSNLQVEEVENSFNLNSFQNYNKEKKKAGIAVLYSLLLPGMGEMYAESYDSGIYFTIAEGLSWGALFGFNYYSDWQKDNYKAFAASNGGVNVNSKDEDYFATIGEYMDIEEYNRAKALNREFKEMYNSETAGWQWESNLERERYRTMWEESELASNSIQFVVGAMIVNRIVSAINAARLVSNYNEKLDESGWSLSAGFSNPQNLPPSISLNFTTNF